jgi:hypothetical protein
MMLKKYRIYILIIFVLGVLAFVLYMNDKPGTLKVESHVFSVTDTSRVTKIILGDGKLLVTLERQGNGWVVNRGFNARPNAVKMLLNVLSGLEISSPVSKTMNDEVTKSFTTDALSVTVESSGEVIKSYRISESDSLRIGSLAILSGDNTPYVVHLTGYDGRITRLFPVDSQFWRDKTLFSYRPADVLSIDVDYSLNPENSFTYQFFGPGDMKIKSLSNNQSVTIDKSKALNFLRNFSSVPFRLVDSKNSTILFDSLNNQKPFCEIKVKDTGNQLKVVKLYQIRDVKNPGRFNVNFMYALVQDDKVPVVVKYIDLDPIMRKFSDFNGK